MGSIGSWRLWLCAGILGSVCGTVAPAQKVAGIVEWLTTDDQHNLIAPQPPLAWSAGSGGQEPSNERAIVVDPSHRYQTMDGFGHALTGGSAELLEKMSAPARAALERKLFAPAPAGAAMSYLRISVGASDMNARVFTYDDMPAGQSDPELKHFTLAEDLNDVVPVLKEILRINPKIHIVASPWTAPSWMKDNDDPRGGHLKPEDYNVYAHYLVRYLQAMQQQGIHIEALTPQNEPENDRNTPSMVFSAEQEDAFVRDALGPALHAAHLKTKLIVFDHNCDHPQYPLTILKDPAAARFVDGAGFHLYLGQISAMSQVHDEAPSKNLYFTEQMVVPRRGRDNDFPASEAIARLIIAAPANWSRNVLLWNLAADSQAGPHTGNGGCPFCFGAVTIDGDAAKLNLAYYVSAQASEFVPSGSVRIDSGASDAPLPHVAYLTPDHKRVLVVSNPSDAVVNFRIVEGKRSSGVTLPAHAAATLVW